MGCTFHRLVFLLPCLLIFFFTGCADKPLSLFPAETGAGSKVSTASFTPLQETVFFPVELRGIEAAAPFLLAGDVRNDKNSELILVDGNTVTIYTPEGTELASKTFQILS